MAETGDWKKMMSSKNFLGVGLRHQHFPFLEKRPKLSIDWFEIISENFMYTEGRPRYMLDLVREQYPVGMHGVSLSIAGQEDLNWDYLRQLKKLAKRINPIFVSDHLCWTGKSKSNLHNLLPFEYTSKNLQTIARRVLEVQDFLERPLSLENLSAYFTLKSSTMTEWQFLKELQAKTNCQILLDVNNVFVNATNQKFEAKDFLDAISLDGVSHLHIAGHSDMGSFLFDTHSTHVAPQVWSLLEYKLKEMEAKSRVIPILLEWDDNIPEFSVVEEEVLKVKSLGINQKFISNESSMRIDEGVSP